MRIKVPGPNSTSAAASRRRPLQSLGRRWRLVGAIVFGHLALAGIRFASAGEESGHAGISGRQVREDAVRAIPFDKLPEDVRRKISSVVSNPSVFRRVPVQAVDCDPDLYLFLVRHPEVVVNIWQVMGISKVALVRVGPDTYQGSDGAGTVGTIRLCYSNHDTQVVYAEGAYEGPMFARPLRTQCVLVLRAGYVQETNGRYYITNRLDAFIHFENVGVDLVAKTFAPLVTKTVDVNFRETAAFISTLSRAAETNSRGIQRLAGKLTTLEPDVRKAFVALSHEVADKASKHQALLGDESKPKLTSTKPAAKQLKSY